MSALPNNTPEESPSNTPSSRTASVLVDELGISIKADLRIRVVKEVAELFEMTPASEHADLLEKVIVIGATNVVTTAEISATDSARMKLEQSADRLLAAHKQVLEQQTARDLALGEQVEKAIKALRTQVEDSTKQEAALRKQLKESQDEIVKVSKQLDVSREDLEKKAGKAITDMVQAQTKAKEEVVKGTETALKKLMDKDNPGSAPAAINAVMGKAAAEMREATSKNIDGLVKDLTKQFGENSPLVEKIAATVRKGAEEEIKRVEEQVEKLRLEMVKDRTREAHSPNLRGESYEDDLLQLFTGGASIYGWTVDRTGTETGESAGSKKGDHLLTDDTGQTVAAIEARARKNVSAKQFYEGAAQTGRNRGARTVVYCARTVEDLPSGIGEFSRGQMPFSYRRLPDGIGVIATVINPQSESVVERLAVLLWIVDLLHRQRPDKGSAASAAERITEAVPRVQALTERLKTFRTIKSGLTKTGSELERVVGTVEQLEADFTSDLRGLEDVLRGDLIQAAASQAA